MTPESKIDLLTSTRRRLGGAGDEWEAGKDSEAQAEDALMGGEAEAA